MKKKTIALEVNCGNSFQAVAKKAKNLARVNTTNVEFIFNGIICIVSEDTNLENLYRYYGDAFIMDWKTVGYDCLDEYPEDISNELYKRKLDLEERQRLDEVEYNKKEDAKKVSLMEKIYGLTIELKDEQFWIEHKKINAEGGYGAAVMKYAEDWALLMQWEISQGKQVKDIAEATGYAADTYGLTVFMYGCAVQELAACWKYGEELRKWHNKKYGHEG